MTAAAARIQDAPVPAVARAGRDRVQAAGQWPPERTAAVRLARARDTVDRAAATGDPRAQALARRHIDAVEADARTCLSRPALVGVGREEQAASARARAGLARMLDPDPVTRVAGTDDLTRAWPAEHLHLLRAFAEHDHHRRAEDAAGATGRRGDAVERARAAVAAIPAAGADTDADTDETDPDVALGSHHHERGADERTDSDAPCAAAEMATAGSQR